MKRTWQEIESMLDSAAGLNGEALEAWLAVAPDELRRLLADGTDFSGWAATAAVEIAESPPRLRLPCTLGHYHVVRKLAEGGMGEVYEARDERLNRKVAIKVLAGGSAGRLADEARALAGLKHPNICRVFDIGYTEGIDYLVMELLDGAPLSDRLRKGQLPLAEALTIGRAVASALAEAHRSGIVHRDVKPANILLTRNGPSLVDFGIAAWIAGGAGVAAGTPPYMAPEQALGICDARSDIYSAGCVLREMVAPDAPEAVLNIINSCVRAEPDERWQGAADLARALEWLAAPLAPAPARRAWIGYALAGVFAAAAFILALRHNAAPQTPVLIPLRGVQNNAIQAPRQIALSPDGARIAFSAPSEAGTNLIWIRRLGEQKPVALPATAGAFIPFWSPDGRSLGMFRNQRLQTLDLAMGEVRTLTALTASPQHAVWRGDTIYYATVDSHSSIYSISASGGEPERMTELNSEQEESRHWQPVPLADGRHFLYLAVSLADVWNVPGNTFLTEIGSGRRTLILRRAMPVGAAGDRVFYLRDRKLWSQRLNVRTGEWSDEPRPEVSGVAWADVNPSGMIAYLPADDLARPVWLDRKGAKLGELPIPEGDIAALALSRNGDVAVLRGDDDSAAPSLWVVRGNHAERIGSSPGGYVVPLWSPDGKYIFFARSRALYRRLAVAGAEEEIVLPEGPAHQVLSTFTPDGNYAYGVAFNPTLRHGFDIFGFDMRTRKVSDWSATQAGETQPQLSPDGRWMAWLCEYPRLGRLCISPANDPRQVSYATTMPVLEPIWSLDGTRLYFRTGNLLHSMRISFNGGRVKTREPERLFRFGLPAHLRYLGYHYAVASDDRFLVTAPFHPTPDPVLIWNPALVNAGSP